MMKLKDAIRRTQNSKKKETDRQGTKKPIRVRDVYDPEQMLAVLVDADEPLEDVLRRFAEEAWLRGVFVIDETEQLVGVITRTDLLDWARLRLGTALRGMAYEPDHLARLGRLVGSAKARDAIHPDSQQAVVQPDDPVDHAVQLMLEQDLIAIPVVDDERRILGDLTLSRVLRHLLDLNNSKHEQT
jgi:CBS domain-containing protein